MNEPSKNTVPLSVLPNAVTQYTRLSIADLLLITLGTAIAIWILYPPDASRDVPYAVATVFVAPFYGSAVAAVLLASYRWVRWSEPVAMQSGHWLLLIIGPMFCGIGLETRSTSKSVDIQLQSTAVIHAVMALVGGLLILVSLSMWTGSIVASADQARRWQRVFQLLGWTVFLWVLGSCLPTFGPGPTIAVPVIMLTAPILLLIAVIAAIAIDLWQRQYRDHWHWLGVGAFLGIPLHLILVIIAVQYSS